MRILISYFGYTGENSTVAMLARSVAEDLGRDQEVVISAIEPQRPRSYWNWLVRSFLPGSRVSIKPVVSDLAPYDVVCLGLPKWTFSCPPVNEYLHRIQNARGRRFCVFLSYGGWDEERYLKALIRAVDRKGGTVIATLAMKRSRLLSGDFGEDVARFCRTIRSRNEI
ncbi:MAG: hypothetical protein HY645_04940 [Acidobacteria bacterium]|nr:hypothetical protein [Acidobacteriota bacterium]